MECGLNYPWGAAASRSGAVTPCWRLGCGWRLRCWQLCCLWWGQSWNFKILRTRIWYSILPSNKYRIHGDAGPCCRFLKQLLVKLSSKGWREKRSAIKILNQLKTIEFALYQVYQVHYWVSVCWDWGKEWVKHAAISAWKCNYPATYNKL